VSESPHCPTCRCEQPTGALLLTVYPANEILYGRCEKCRTVRHATESCPADGPPWEPVRSEHCGCCTHPHDLAPGGHVIAGGAR